MRALAELPCFLASSCSSSAARYLSANGIISSSLIASNLSRISAWAFSSASLGARIPRTSANGWMIGGVSSGWSANRSLGSSEGTSNSDLWFS